VVGLTAPVRLPADEAVVWHDVECAAYEDDLPVWRALAAAAGGPVLDLGCGTGRVALDLAARGHEVTAVDADEALVRALARRARERGLRVRAHAADARALAAATVGREFALAIAPMQVVQLLGGPAGRARMLDAVAAHLRAGAALACAIADPLEGLPAGEHVLPPIADVAERDGWRFESRPVALRVAHDGALAIDRLREATAPDGSVRGAIATIELDRVEAGDLEAEAVARGWRVLPRRAVPESEGWAGATIACLEAPR
jgi:SAM-dependent methyltransferase